MATVKGRLERLEKRVVPGDDHIPYVTLTADEYERYAAGDLDLGGTPGKIYIGWGPDEWDDDDCKN